TAAMNNPAPVLALGTLVGWSLWRRLREIPPPILLVAAGGIAGLMRWNDDGAAGERPGHRLAYGRGDPTRLEPPLAGSRWDTAAGAGAREQHGDMAARAREVAAETGARISDTAERAREVVSDTAERAAAGISRAVGDATGTASDLGRQARSQFYDLVDKHPLVLGGIGLAIGAALAAAMRPTETEARLVGETSDRFRRRARELGEAQFERAQAIAERAYEAGWHEARAQGLSVDAGREAESEVGDEPAAARRAKKAAKEE